MFFLYPKEAARPPSARACEQGHCSLHTRPPVSPLRRPAAALPHTPHPTLPPLAPQRKKACIVARQRMEEAMRLQEQQQGSGSGGAAPSAAARLPPDPADDPFTAALSKILSSTGGVAQERHVALLLQLVRRARSKAHRHALLVVLQRSAGEVQRQAVAGKLLLELQGWLSEAVAQGDAKRVHSCLACLDRLPVSLAALQPPCELGKVVGKLRKHESFGSAVTEPAKRLVARWKGLVEAAQAKKAAGAAAGGTARSAPLPPPLLRRLPLSCMPCVIAAPQPAPQLLAMPAAWLWS